MSETKREHTRWSQPEEHQAANGHGEGHPEKSPHHGHEGEEEHHDEHKGEHGKEGHHGEHGEHGHHSDEEHEHEHFEGDFYELLEVTRESTTAEIKKSYQRLAMRWHPDKNPENQEKAKKMFQHLGEAYEILSDDHKRDSYNKYGREGMKDHGGEESDEEDMGCGCCAGASDPFEMFKMMFGDIDPYALVMRSMVTPGGIRGMMGGGCGPMQMPVGRNALVLRRPKRQAMSPYGMPNGRGQMAGYVPNSNTTTTGMLSNGQKVIVRRVVNNGVETTTTYDRTGTLINSNVRVIGPQMRLDNVIPQMMGGCGMPYDDEDSDEEEDEEDEEDEEEEDESGEVTNAAVGSNMPPPMRTGPPTMMTMKQPGGNPTMTMQQPGGNPAMSMKQPGGNPTMTMKQPGGNNVAAVPPMMRTGLPVTITRINSASNGSSGSN